MKTQKTKFFSSIVLLVLFSFTLQVYTQVIYYKTFEPNNISTYFISSGIFNRNITVSNSPGFMWPRGSNKYAIFTSGLCISALVNDSLRMAVASYTGEYLLGYVNNGLPINDTIFRIYKVKKGDNSNNNPDYANWGAMVPFGAPYVDINQNGQYDPGIDKPGVRCAEQTIFMCLTDGFIESHNASEGFGGGTLPLKADLRITVWGYSTISKIVDVHFMKFQIINKNNSPWTHTFSSLVSDPDLGNPNDDYVGCDTLRKLSYCYNATNIDSVYGYAPPAVGFLLLKGLVNHSIIPNVNIGLTSSIIFHSDILPIAVCEGDPNGDSHKAYLFMKGFKNDSTPFLNPTTIPPTKTKFLYTGDPETNIGWTESKGSIRNCSGDTSSFNIISVNPPGDRRLIMSMGAENFTMAPNDTQTIIISQLIARGSSNLNSVTKLKALSDTVRNIYNSNFNLFYIVSGNVKYLDNSQNVTSGSVKAFRLDNSNGQIMILDSTGIQPDGSFILNNVPLGDAYIGAVPNSTTQTDYVTTYYPSSIYWQGATLLNVSGNLSNINIRTYRLTTTTSSRNVNGIVYSSAPVITLNGANVYAKSGNTFVGFGISSQNGSYSLTSLPAGSIKIIADRIGYKSDSITVYLSNSLIDSINFHLTKIYIGINPISTVIPDKYLLQQNYPNPFNPTTKIKFSITPFDKGGTGGFVSLKVYNILGKEVITLVNEKLNPGEYEVTFNGSDLPSGIYFYVLNAGDYKETKKMLLIK